MWGYNVRYQYYMHTADSIFPASHPIYLEEFHHCGEWALSENDEEYAWIIYKNLP